MSQPAAPTVVDDTLPPASKPAFDFDRMPFAAVAVWIACVLLSLLCNSGAFVGQEWIWTDDALVGRNPLIGMLSGLQQVWTGLFHYTPVSLDHVSGSAPSLRFSTDHYLLPQFSPLAQTLFFFERQIFGDAPLGYRIVSAVLHGSCGLMLYQLLRGLKVPGAIIAALLFVAHPILVDSVSFLTERRNPLGALFGLSAVYVFLRATKLIEPPVGKMKFLPDETSRLYLIGAALFVLGLLAQPAIAPLMLVTLLIFWAKRVTIPFALVTTALALVIAGVGLLGVAAKVETSHSGYSAKQWERAPTAAGEMAVRTQIAGRAVFVYAQKLVLPYPLSMDYGRWITPNDLADFQTFGPPESKERFANMKPTVGAGNVVAWVFPLLVIGALVALYVLAPKIGRVPFLLVASFVLLLLPFLGFIDLGWMQYSFVANRAAYLAVIPFAVGVVFAIAPLLAQPSQRVSMIASVVIVLVLFARLSLGLSFRYQMNLEFWRDANIASSSRKGGAGALNALTGTPWYSRFQAANYLLIRRPDQWKDAVNAYNDVLDKIRPGNPEVLVQLGRVLTVLKQDPEAMARFQFVIDNYPDYGPAYRAAGDLLRQQADLAPTNPALRYGALGYYEAAVEADPRDAAALLLVAETAYGITGRLPDSDQEGIKAMFNKAAEAFDAADLVRPYDVQQLLRSSRTLIQMGLLAPAASNLLKARAIEPENPAVFVVIGDAALARNEIQGAEASYRQAIDLDETYVDAYLNLSAMMATQRRFDEARKLLDDAVALLPDSDALRDAKEKLADVEAIAATQPVTAPQSTDTPSTMPANAE